MVIPYAWQLVTNADQVYGKIWGSRESLDVQCWLGPQMEHQKPEEILYFKAFKWDISGLHLQKAYILYWQ